MAENYEDPAGSTQMFRAFVETPQVETQSNVSVHRAGSGGGRSGMIVIGAVVALAVVAVVVWLAVK
ncbi:hypothetical protein C7C46_12485 [Streptomyces tateyamensis]|uniref:Uncharacterized protein n=1 Tax=Streptomyces tateyamensis TaxID=565073 RepID=A0A2V4NAU9_9ACTN|nr:hypothetical protein [Streptomyces tateyamensis]PYC80510.1 hypothetical protein C7C46_12485 [Streptomyces tateyamensis]